MSSTAILFKFFALPCALFALVTCAPLRAKDVFVPPVTYPEAGTVWHTGSWHTVTWNVSGAPAEITNTKGMVVLAKNNIEDWEHPLARGFDIMKGSVDIQVPWNLSSSNDYAIVLFGDSGNYSPTFTIDNVN